MKKTVLSVVVALGLFYFFKSNTNAINNLPENKITIEQLATAQKTLTLSVRKYQQCARTKNYLCQASFMLPSIVQASGGEENLAKMIKTSTESVEDPDFKLVISKTEIAPPAQVYKRGDVFVSIVESKTPLVIKGKTSELKSYNIAVSKSVEGPWALLDSSRVGRRALTMQYPNALKGIQIPKSTH